MSAHRVHHFQTNHNHEHQRPHPPRRAFSPVRQPPLVPSAASVGEPIKLAHEFIQNFIAQGNDGAQLEAEIFNIVANPPAFFADELRAPLARAIYRPAFTPRAELAPWRQWGEGLEAEAVKQMANELMPI